MDPEQLSADVAETGVTTLEPEDPAPCLRALESHADDAGGARLLRVIDDVASLLAVREETAPVVGHLRRTTLVRWDASSATWLGTPIDGHGTLAMVRALRPGVRTPLHLRQFGRLARALAPVAPGLVFDASAGTIRIPVTGDPLSPRRGAALARTWSSALEALQRWQGAGVGVPAPSSEEFRVDADGVAELFCLTPGEQPFGAVVSALARRLTPDADDDGALVGWVRGAAHAGVTDLDEARRATVRALAQDLASQRHALARAWVVHAGRWRRGRLAELIRRMDAAVPVRDGFGAVGVDLEGRTTVIRAAQGRVTWGPDGAAEVLFDAEEGFRAPLARRMLRARASSPSNPSLQARVGGDADAADAVCRWVAAGLRLRTVALLLERAP